MSATAQELWASWEFDPGVVAPLALSGLLYLRGARQTRGVTAGQMACFWSGWASLTLALISPLHHLGEELFSAHMLQHEVLILVCAPLLVLSRPLVPILWGLPLGVASCDRRDHQIAGRAGGMAPPDGPPRGLVASRGGSLGLALPALFQATLTSDWAHTAQHLSFLLSALLFWWSLFYSHGRRGYGAAVLYVFTTALHTSILGVLLTFAPRLWYPAYAATTTEWGLTPLADQQLGGLIMWVPAGVVYMGLGLYLFALWLRESEAMVARRWYAQ